MEISASNITYSSVSLSLCAIYYAASIFIVVRCQGNVFFQKRHPIFVMANSFINCGIGLLYILMCTPLAYSVPSFVIFWLQYLFITPWYASNLVRDLHVLLLHYMNKARLLETTEKGNQKVSKSLTENLPALDRLVLRLAVQLRIWIKMGKNLVSCFGERKSHAQTTTAGSMVQGSVTGSMVQGSVTGSMVQGSVTGSMVQGSVTGSVAGSTAGFYRNSIASSSTKRSVSVSVDLKELVVFSSSDMIFVLKITFLYAAVLTLILTCIIPGYSLIPVDYYDPMVVNRKGAMALYIHTGLFFIFKGILTFCLRGIDDTIGFRTESILTILVILINFVLYLAKLQPFGLSYQVFIFLAASMAQFVNTFLPAFWIIMAHLGKKKLLNYDNASLQKVLRTPKLLAKLSQIMGETYCMENILFHEEYCKLLGRDLGDGSKLNHNSNNSSSASLPEAATAIKRIYVKYIKLQSPYELNISDQLRKQVSKSIADGNNEEAMGLIEQVDRDVLTMIMNNSFPVFLKRNKGLEL